MLNLLPSNLRLRQRSGIKDRRVGQKWYARTKWCKVGGRWQVKEVFHKNILGLTQASSQVLTLSKDCIGTPRLDFLGLRFRGLREEVEESSKKLIPNGCVGVKANCLNQKRQCHLKMSRTVNNLSSCLLTASLALHRLKSIKKCGFKGVLSSF